MRSASVLFALAALAYVGVIVWFSPLPLQDVPNHLARANVMADLLFQHGVEFGHNYSFHLQFTSYLGGDLPLAALVQLVGVRGGAIIWGVLSFLSFPAAVYLYLRVTQASREVLLLMLFVSLWLSTDAFFVMGFLEFKLSMALVLVGFAVIELLRERWSVTYFALVLVLMVATYLVHLAAVVFIGALSGVSALWRISQGRSRATREAILLVPVVCILLWHLFGAAAYRQPDEVLAASTKWGTLATKLNRLPWDFRRYNRLQDHVMTGAFVVFFAGCLLNRRVASGREWLKSRVAEPLSYAILFFALYLALPFAHRDATYVDARALALAPFFLFEGLLSLSSMTEPTGPDSPAPPEFLTVCLAVGLVCVNLALLSLNFWRDAAWLAKYRATVAQIPMHATVLPIYTDEHAAIPLERLHAASYAVIDRKALIPYLFSGDRGHPMTYFRYLHRPYAPPELWYRDGTDSTVDWEKVREQYSYLLVAKPFTAARIPVRTRAVAQSDAAVLLAVESVPENPPPARGGG